MTTTLQQAQDAYKSANDYLGDAETANEEGRLRTRYYELHNMALQDASILAQLAQADALTRIADALETMLEQDTLAENVRIYGTERNQA